MAGEGVGEGLVALGVGEAEEDAGAARPACEVLVAQARAAVEQAGAVRPGEAARRLGVGGEPLGQVARAEGRDEDDVAASASLELLDEQLETPLELEDVGAEVGVAVPEAQHREVGRLLAGGRLRERGDGAEDRRARRLGPRRHGHQDGPGAV